MATMASTKDGSRRLASGIGITVLLERHGLGWTGMYYVVI